tara:strand:+ start:2813 stop:4072 length:1260 start_codon:yes stop_codon:yes gene_type:complete
MKIKLKYIFIIVLFNICLPQKILIPMDQMQTDHLKAYGIAFLNLKKSIDVEWLLNYRGGSFLFDDNSDIKTLCTVRGVYFESINASKLSNILTDIEANNMDIVLLEKEPKIAVYSPPDKQPWDDAVTLALTYAEIDYEVIFDDEVINGKMNDYDWLHLHHEDFTGQYGKFYRSYKNASWYLSMEKDFNRTAKKHGFKSVHELKKYIALKIKQYVAGGGFLFAMCSATDSFDIALAAQGIDIVESVFDGSPVSIGYQSKLNFSNGMAFENYSLITNPMIYEYSNIDYPSNDKPNLKTAEKDYFTLFEFSAKWDPVPTMLTQNHVGIINGFMGQTTGFNRKYLKKHVVILAEVENDPQVKYIHGNVGRGTFTFLGGHDPEDYTHKIGDPVTDLSLHRNSPGYRLILNNVLFPAARKKDRKT